MMTEDEVRQKAAGIIDLGNAPDAKSGTGQITSFNQLGFKGVTKKPDGWYLPDDVSQPALILETKNEGKDLDDARWVSEIQGNCDVVMQRYANVVGVLYNGDDVRAFLNNHEVEVVPDLQGKDYYLGLFSQGTIDKERIYTLTKRINDSLHIDFGIKNLYHRMIFTACAIVATRYGAPLMKGMDYATFHTSIFSTLSKSLDQSKRRNQKLELLLDVYSEIKMNSTENQNAIDCFIDSVTEISKSLANSKWNGEDVMGIFFNEFNRYKKKTERGQVFTPDHITSLMYRLGNVDKSSRVLDAACGSGAFLVKAMYNMLSESGGQESNEAPHIKGEQLFGIEYDREIYALACANMLIHKDGKTNLVQMDSRTDDAHKWMASKHINKVLMNPPFENKYGCMKIVENVLNSVDRDADVVFILPDKKLEKASQAQQNRLMKHHTIEKIIKLPEALFFNVGVTASIFMFKAGVPQNDKEIFTCYIEDDGLKTVKNQGRHDVNHTWATLENYWVDSIRKCRDDVHHTDAWIKPSEHLSYQMPHKPFEVHSSDFHKTTFDSVMYNNGDGEDANEFKTGILNDVLYASTISTDANGDVVITIPKQGMGAGAVDISSWVPTRIGKLFDIKKGRRLTKRDMTSGDINFIGASIENNGVTAHIGNTEHLHPANTITVAYNGSVGASFYQTEPFWASDDINVLYPKFDIDEDIAQFLIPLFERKGREYAYTDKWRQDVMIDDEIPIPVDSNGNPDWDYMRNYMSNVKNTMTTSTTALLSLTHE